MRRSRSQGHLQANESEESDGELIEEDQEGPQEEEKEVEQSVDSSHTSARGRPRVHESWSRVMHVTAELNHRGR